MLTWGPSPSLLLLYTEPRNLLAGNWCSLRVQEMKKQELNMLTTSSQERAGQGIASGTQGGPAKGLTLVSLCSSLLKNSQHLPNSYDIKSQAPVQAL